MRHLAVEYGCDNALVPVWYHLRDIGGGEGVGEARGQAQEDDAGV